MTIEQDLEAIRDSLLEPKKDVAPKETSILERSAVDFTEALMQLPQIALTLKDLAFEKQRQNDYASIFTQINSEIQTLVQQTHSNLKQTDSLTCQIKNRLDGFDLLEAKYSNMIERVNAVLTVLEKYLKQVT